MICFVLVLLYPFFVKYSQNPLMPQKCFLKTKCFMYEGQVLVNRTAMDVSELFFLSLVRRLRAGAYQEEAAGGSLLCADLSYCSSIKEAASHRPQYVLSCRPGAHQSCQDQILTGTLMCL